MQLNFIQEYPNDASCTSMNKSLMIQCHIWVWIRRKSVDTRRDKTWPINTNRTKSPASSITRERRNVTCSILYATFHLYSCLTHTPPSIFTQCHIQEQLSNVRKPKVDLHVLSTPESSLYQHLQQHAVFLTLVSSAKCICTQSCWKKNAWCLKELQTCSANQ